MLRGLRLGTSVDELKAQHPHLELKPANEQGESSADVLQGSEASNELDFDGLWEIRLRFLDGRLSNVDYLYLATDPLRPHEFINIVTEKIGLDARWCQYPTRNQCVISCDGFEVSIKPQVRDISGGGINTDSAMVTFNDHIAKQKLEARRRAKEEEEKQSFRP
jgi:hypothetical protein